MTASARSFLCGRDPVEHDEQLSRLLRVRKAGTIALIAWPLFGLLDWFIVTYLQPGRFEFYLAIRVLGMILVGLGVASINTRRIPSHRVLSFVEAFICTSLAALISLQCLEFRGIDSPLVLGIVIVLLARGALLGDHWKRSVTPVAMAAVTYPAVILALSLFSPKLAVQFSDPEALAGFILNVGFVLSAAALTLVGGHAVWTLRRQLSKTRSLGRYELKQLIGKGGMGEVWAAFHQSLRRNVAVKILRPDSRNDSVAIGRFEREVRATAELNHPNTVRVYDYGVTDDGLWYYAMELLEGEDLGSLIRRGPVSPQRAVDMIGQASRALAEAHTRGIIHRDIKPENLFVTSLGGECDFIKVLDFGLAKLAASESSTAHDSNLTQAGWAVGTPSFVSPEVVMGKPADARSDIYALGAVLYTLLTGATPFAADDMRAVLMAHLRETPRLPSARLGRALPGSLEQVIMKCLEKDPERRYASATHLAHALSACLTEQPVAAHLRAPTRARTRPPERQRARSYAPTYIGRHEWPELQDVPDGHDDAPTAEDHEGFSHQFITAH